VHSGRVLLRIIGQTNRCRPTEGFIAIAESNTEAYRFTIYTYVQSVFICLVEISSSIMTPKYEVLRGLCWDVRVLSRQLIPRVF
jgi:hypothetical protein